MFSLLQQSPIALAAAAFVFGLLVGSFLNVVIHRLPLMLERQWHAQCRELLEQNTAAEADEPFNLVVPRSRCPQCGHKISALENVPILSYLFLRGRCAGCGAPISPRYPIVELVTGLLSGIVAWHLGFSPETAAALVLTWTLIALSVIDLDHQILPDAITLPVLWLGLALSLGAVFADPRDSIIGALSGYLALWAVFWVFKWATGKEGMGYGDFKLLGMLGAWMGWQLLPLVVILSSLVGAVTGIGLIALQGRDHRVPIPFGPFLAAAGWIALLWGSEITQAYLRWSGIAH
ncbi:MAG: prepilin peptidase [Gammaproteobacteria bacterium]|nr:prepilin peptidase [Gammaproteobacteria bacterium]NIR98335.1 prepilin peptidase [Gammaproteobacteria bacterium]NIT64082.1 prepilin peptidase [Gammaproteobacteria bacterium]NIV21013.1 prepilin peptidase [Gammaproteobacteria bacterium]NIX10410.1 prepilin peptidase [Gammaproteobacteria bacterium]